MKKLLYLSLFFNLLGLGGVGAIGAAFADMGFADHQCGAVAGLFGVCNGGRHSGRVMAIWIMAFGGTVPIGALVAGPLIERFGMTDVMLFGAICMTACVFLLGLFVMRSKKVLL